MSNEKIIQMIDEYLEEPHSINKDWVEALQTCRQALLDNERLKAGIERKTTECERLEIYMNELVKHKLNQEKSEAIKEFAERLKCKASILRDKVTGLPCSYTISNYDFNRLVKELTETPTKIEHSSLCETESYEVKE